MPQYGIDVLGRRSFAEGFVTRRVPSLVFPCNSMVFLKYGNRLSVIDFSAISLLVFRG
jgi:hypothetical protein